MSAAHYTPGPWAVSGGRPKTLTIMDHSMPRKIIARVPNVGYPPEAHVNARLIAAAPDLLSALELLYSEHLMRMLDAPADRANYATQNSMALIAHAAISQARGEA